MKISLTIYIDPLRLEPEFKLHEVHLKVADAFARVISNENLLEINGFEMAVDYDQEQPDVPGNLAHNWMKRFNKTSREDRSTKK